MVQAVVINLTRHQDRLAWFMENARRVKMDVARIEAIDAKEPSVQHLIDEHVQLESALSRAEVACILSHRKSWQWLLDSNEPYLAIFEDDVHLSEDISELLQLVQIPQKAGLIKLEYPLHRVAYVHKPYARINGRSLHRLLTNAYGSAGYIVSRACAKRLLELTETSNVAVDSTLFNQDSLIWKEFIVLQVVPAACIQDLELSKINKSNSFFESDIAVDRNNMLDQKKLLRCKKKSWFSTVKIPRYLKCVMHGAHPFRYREYVNLDLGYPKRDLYPRIVDNHE